MAGGSPKLTVESWQHAVGSSWIVVRGPWIVGRINEGNEQRAGPMDLIIARCYTSLHISYRAVGRNLMDTTKLSSKGQVILPKHIRTAHKWWPGVEFSVEDTAEGVLLRPLKLFKPTQLEDVIR